jgi:hypothetical protein
MLVTLTGSAPVALIDEPAGAEASQAGDEPEPGEETGVAAKE